MDVQRIILIGALCLISYMLVLQWNQDYGQPAEAQQATTSVSAYETQPVATDLPAADDSAQKGDLPATAVQAQQASLIDVKTDVLNVVIDTKGGDIIQVSLPDYKASLGSELPFVLLEQTSNRTYVSQSGLVGRNGPDASPNGRPTYTSAQSEFDLDGQESISVDLTYTTEDSVQITKRYTFSKGSYEVGLEFIVNNQSSETWKANLFGQIKRDRSDDPTSTTEMGMQSYLGPVFSTLENNYQKYDFDDIDDSPFKESSKDGWVAMSQHYFLSAWIPEKGAEYNYQSRKLNGNYIVGFLSPDFSVPAGESKTVTANFFAGPKDQEIMELADQDLDLTVDYGVLWWIASPLYMLLKWVYGLVGNWGLAIIGITIIVKAALFQLNAKAFKSMAKMRKFGPEMTRLKELYGDDRQKMSQEMMKLYQKEKINPLGGCLPIVAQMPIFIALYWVLMESVDLRHAEFLYLADLSVKDPYFILPIIMGASMFIQQMLNPTPPDPMQAKIMKMLPIMFTFFFLWFPAGLTLYWVVNNILSIAQQYVINKQIENE
ncbi:MULTISPECIES: membrane protein insertase YidC [unclassified Neptuniibacter]|uniref:membrane protein insertase YidC n=1 Tax=unclassified Neptuniibacter TaxID=2630693 RepID=UPI0025FD9601|nr:MULTISPECIES: membrane protein insertase YidC [unclassified Neptuniibacter]|tara:strand:+ start:6216 stop:7853 length:1638 start_codon:yes stop_codon:yes gene_type:complete